MIETKVKLTCMSHPRQDQDPIRELRHNGSRLSNEEGIKSHRLGVNLSLCWAHDSNALDKWKRRAEA